MRKNTLQLAFVAEMYNINTKLLIEPMKLAVALCRHGMGVSEASGLCGVGRTALHRKIKSFRSQQTIDKLEQ